MTKLANTTFRIQALVATLLLTTLTLPALAQSDIYKVTHPDGTIGFTDQPPSGSHSSSVELLDNNGTNIVPGLAPEPETAQVEAESEELVVTELIPKSVDIMSPIDQTTIPMGPGHFSVLAQVEPELEPGETLQLVMDNTPLDDPITDTTWNLRFVIRGEHTLFINRLDSAGKVIAISEPVVVYVLRPSIR
ncbi:MAG: hypothetical protein L7S45_02855 [Luminiphilus sp.]|nr:hypothetical protein [Luminiphilus sp.]